MSNSTNVVITSGTTTSSPPFNVGWQCPGCGKCYAPTASECRTCGKDESEQEPVTDIPQFEFVPGTTSPCPHLFTTPSTSGSICASCGVVVSPPPFTVTWGNTAGGAVGTTVNIPSFTILGQPSFTMEAPSLQDLEFNDAGDAGI